MNIKLFAPLLIAAVLCSCSGDDCQPLPKSEHLSESIAHFHEGYEYELYENGIKVGQGEARLQINTYCKDMTYYSSMVEMRVVLEEKIEGRTQTIFSLNLEHVPLIGQPGDVTFDEKVNGIFQNEAELIGVVYESASVKVSGSVWNDRYVTSPSTRCDPVGGSINVDLTAEITPLLGDDKYTVKLSGKSHQLF